MDVAHSILEGKAGTLHVGFSKGPYQRQLLALWVQLGGLVALILISFWSAYFDKIMSIME